MRQVIMSVLLTFAWVLTASAGRNRPDLVRVVMTDSCECLDFAKATNDPNGNSSVFWVRRGMWSAAPISMLQKPLIVSCYPDGPWIDDATAQCVAHEKMEGD